MRTEDGDLVRQCLNGDATAFGFLVDRYKEAVYASAYAKVRNFADAQDLTQEAFIKAYQNLGSLRQYDRFRAWLYAITANLCKNFLRSKASRPDGEFVEVVEQEVLDRPAMEVYQRKQTYEPLYEALESLPDIYRQVLSLHYLGGMKSREIAQFLGTSVTNINARLSRARALLKEEMIEMMSTTFDEMRLQPGFTFRLVEAIKQTKIQTPPSQMTLPFGISAVAGLIVLLLSFSVSYSPLYPIGQLIGSALPSQTQVAEDGVISVDTIEITQIVSLSPEMEKGDFGKKPLPESTNVFGGGGKWERKADMPTERATFSGGVIDGKIYVVGGWKVWADPGSAMATLEIYDPLTDTWEKGLDMPTPRGGLVTAVVDGVLYAISGGQGRQGLPAVEAYDPASGKWEKRANIPNGGYTGATSVVDGKIYVIGGWFAMQRVQMYDPATDTWTQKAAMPTGRAVLATAVVDRKIYAIGGDAGAGVALRTVEMYDPATDTWTRKANAPFGIGGVATAVIDGKIYVIGGATGPRGQALPTVSVYDPLTDIWEEKPEMPTPRSFLSVSVVNGKIYAIGGSAKSILPIVPLSTVEEYTLNEEQPFAVSSTGKLATTWGEVKATQ